MFNKKISLNHWIGYFKFIIVSLFIGTLLGCNSEGAYTPTGDKGEVQSIQITYSPKTLGTSSFSVAKGSIIQFTATAIYADDSTEYVTHDVEWVSDTPNTLSIDDKGSALGKDVGQSIVQATLGKLKSNAVTVDVTDAVITSIQVTPANASLAKGQSQKLTAMAVFSDGTSKSITSSVTWKSADTTIATITKDGLLSALKAGNISITAVKDGVTSNTANMEVTNAVITSIQVTPANASLAKGQSQKLTAMAVFSDGTSKSITNSVTWKSADTAIATVTKDGLLSALKAGNTSITAVKDGVTSNTANMEVTNAVITSIQVTPAIVSLPKGTALQLTAMAIFSDDSSQVVTDSVTWLSDNTSIATVTKDGLFTGTETGEVVITATKDGVASNAAYVNVTDAVIESIQISPVNISLAKGLTRQLTATAIFSDGTSQIVTDSVTWNSDSAATATVTDKGLLAGVDTGEVLITATKDNVFNDIRAQIINAIIVGIEVAPSNVSLAKGLTQQLEAKAIFSDGTSQDATNSIALTWKSEDTSIATVTEDGLLSAMKEGQTSVIAVRNGINSKPIEITVTDAVITDIEVTPKNVSLAKGLTQQLTATAKLSDGTSQLVTNSVTWRSKDTSIVTVTPDGLLTGVNTGNVAVTATKNKVTSDNVFVEITKDLTVVTWGRRYWGADISSVQNRLTQVKAIYSSFAAFAALKQDGTVVTWGDEHYGSDSRPVQDQLTNVKVIYSTGFAFAALKEDGTVVTWGDNVYGGNSQSVQNQLTDIKVIYSTGFAFAALKENGTVVTWGGGTGADSSSVQSQLTQVKAIYSTGATFAALKQDGTVVTWGDTVADSSSVQNQLTDIKVIYSTGGAFAALKENGTVVDRYGSDSSSVQDQLTNVKVIYSTGGAFSALKEDGTIVTWGENGRGGNSQSVQNQLTDIKVIYSTDGAFAALKQDGTVVTWGDELTGADSSSVQSQLTQVKAIYSTGSAFSALKQDGAVVTWGDRSSGADSSSVQHQLTDVKVIYSTKGAFAAMNFND